jgi:hypothetical protein
MEVADMEVTAAMMARVVIWVGSTTATAVMTATTPIMNNQLICPPTIDFISGEYLAGSGNGIGQGRC